MKAILSVGLTSIHSLPDQISSQVIRPSRDSKSREQTRTHFHDGARLDVLPINKCQSQGVECADQPFCILEHIASVYTDLSLQ